MLLTEVTSLYTFSERMEILIKNQDITLKAIGEMCLSILEILNKQNQEKK